MAIQYRAENFLETKRIFVDNLLKTMYIIRCLAFCRKGHKVS